MLYLVVKDEFGPVVPVSVAGEESPRTLTDWVAVEVSL